MKSTASDGGSGLMEDQNSLPEDVKLDELDLIAKKIAFSRHLVAFTGAGISTASGLPDYRGPNGVWTRREKGLPPILPKKPLDEIEPNDAHHALVELQDLGILKFLISQNVDNLHLKSGIRPELLAELHRNHSIVKCLQCDARFKKDEIGWDDTRHGKGYRTEPVSPLQPKCPRCNGRLISSIVNFGDPMPEKEMTLSYHHAKQCDVMLCLGTSLTVHPAAGIPRLAKKRGAFLIIINRGKTGLDALADIKIEEDVSKLLPMIVQKVKQLFRK